MRDDFAALDLFIAAANAKPGKQKKKLLGLPRRKVKKSEQNEPLAALQPLMAKIKKKQKADAVDAASLQGWSVRLSWAAPSPKADDAAEQAYPLTYSS
jgi:hypothetical protein